MYYMNVKIFVPTISNQLYLSKHPSQFRIVAILNLRKV